MKREEIIESALWAMENNYGSIVLQAGEKQDAGFVEFVEDILREIAKLSKNSSSHTFASISR